MKGGDGEVIISLWQILILQMHVCFQIGLQLSCLSTPIYRFFSRQRLLWWECWQWLWQCLCWRYRVIFVLMFIYEKREIIACLNNILQANETDMIVSWTRWMTVEALGIHLIVYWQHNNCLMLTLPHGPVVRASASNLVERGLEIRSGQFSPCYVWRFALREQHC